MTVAVEIIADTSIKGVPAYRGEILEVTASEANILIQYGKAIAYVPKSQEIGKMEMNKEEAEVEPRKRGRKSKWAK